MNNNHGLRYTFTLTILLILYFLVFVSAILMAGIFSPNVCISGSFGFCGSQQGSMLLAILSLLSAILLVFFYYYKKWAYFALIIVAIMNFILNFFLLGVGIGIAGLILIIIISLLYWQKKEYFT